MTPAGFPHSDIHGSILACSSPWLFAAYRVLLRLLAPRHPPYALSYLTSLSIRRSSISRHLLRCHCGRALQRTYQYDSASVLVPPCICRLLANLDRESIGSGNVILPSFIPLALVKFSHFLRGYLLYYLLCSFQGTCEGFSSYYMKHRL